MCHYWSKKIKRVQDEAQNEWQSEERSYGFLASRWYFASYLWNWCFFSIRKKYSTLVWEKQNCRNKCYSGKEVGNVEKSEEGPIFCISGLTWGWKCWKHHRWAQAVPAFPEICCPATSGTGIREDFGKEPKLLSNQTAVVFSQKKSNQQFSVP